MPEGTAGKCLCPKLHFGLEPRPGELVYSGAAGDDFTGITVSADFGCIHAKPKE